MKSANYTVDVAHKRREEIVQRKSEEVRKQRGSRKE